MGQTERSGKRLQCRQKRIHELKKLAERGTEEAIAVMRFESITIDEVKLSRDMCTER